MKRRDKALVLTALSIGGTLKPLLARGFTFTQISMLLNELIKDGLAAERSNGDFTVTAAGRIFLREDRIRPRGGAQLIAPAIKYKLPKLDKSVLYVPSPKRSSFYRERSR
jgi:hypothetical protein